MNTTDSTDAFLDRAAEAEMGLDHLVRCLQAGPGSAIAYEEALGRPRYRVLPADRFQRVPEPSAVIVWGHADLAEEMVTHRADGESMDDLLGALDETAFDYLGEWYEQGPVPFGPIEPVRNLMYARDFQLNRRSDRWVRGERRIVRDHFVYRHQPFITATAKYTTYTDGRLRTLLRVYDLGRQIKGLISHGPDATADVRALLTAAKAHVGA
ncbi:hypothetical protein GCM10023224_27320 [Streptomonospora halophila]|uniref:MmyB-like transcription regulator ligand binding domain-containing protein n=1 Tax=Streptomonospora halophila TaxID=427369 RepID=A0ABP9GH05_9ACTN